MDGENGGEQPQDEANHDVPPAEASICAASEGEKSAESHHEPGNGSEPRGNVRKITWLEYVLACTNIALVLVGVWALTVYRDQLNVVQGTLDQMKNTAAQADRLITESAKQSKASGDSAKAAQSAG
jgi:hypothetical protein